MLGTIVMAALVAFSVSDADAETLKDCAALDNDLDRLACYDRASGRTPEVTSEPSAGEWEVHVERSKLTDEQNVYLHVESDEIIDCGWSRGGRVTLWVRCVENTTALIFSTGCHMASGSYTSLGDVTYRVDDEKARTVSMSESNNNRSLGLWSGGRSIPVIKQLFGHSKLLARMTPFNENAFTATFNIAGLEDAIEPLRKACHW